MSRLRPNDVSSAASTVTASASAGNTTVTFSAAPPLPAVSSPDFLVLSINPNTANEEIIYVTAFTPAATTATVIRNAEATQGGSNSSAAFSLAPWVCAPTSNDFLPAIEPFMVGAR